MDEFDDLEEEEFDREFDLLMQQIRCPICSRGPVEVDNVLVTELDVYLYCVCEAGHWFMIDREEING